MKTPLQLFVRTAVVMGMLIILHGCAVTTDSTESSSKTFENTTEASSKFTSSTSPSDDSAEVARREQALAFTRVKLERIKTDMAMGGGEHLTSLATLLGVPSHNQQEFFNLTQANFNVLFETQNTNAEQLLAGIDVQLDSHPGLLR